MRVRARMRGAVPPPRLVEGACRTPPACWPKQAAARRDVEPCLSRYSNRQRSCHIKFRRCYLPLLCSVNLRPKGRMRRSKGLIRYVNIFSAPYGPSQGSSPPHAVLLHASIRRGQRKWRDEQQEADCVRAFCRILYRFLESVFTTTSELLRSHLPILLSHFPNTEIGGVLFDLVCKVGATDSKMGSHGELDLKGRQPYNHGASFEFPLFPYRLARRLRERARWRPADMEERLMRVAGGRTHATCTCALQHIEHVSCMCI